MKSAGFFYPGNAAQIGLATAPFTALRRLLFSLRRLLLWPAAAPFMACGGWAHERAPCPAAHSNLSPLMMTRFDDIRADFEFLDDWDDRYKYLIDLGRNLEPYPDALRDDAHKVRGCASQVWLHSEIEAGKIKFFGDSDAHIVRGLVALVLSLYAEKSPREILAINAEESLAPFDLKDHLTPQRSNGLHAMLTKIRAIATETAG